MGYSSWLLGREGGNSGVLDGERVGLCSGEAFVEGEGVDDGRVRLRTFFELLQCQLRVVVLQSH